jgi:transposase
MSPQFLMPYHKGNKNDPNDAEAICEAVTRPSMRFVPIKLMKSRTCRRCTGRVNSQLKPGLR